MRLKNMNNILELPQLIARFSYELPENQIILISGGNQPDIQWLKSISKNKNIFCADHGIV